jgi:peptidoglycan hydrolase-like protein with peptidoglycan-binding domain
VKPVRPSERGSAVEDIQRRLLTLGYDLGPTGVDGVFLGATLSAVRDFQHAQGLADDGIVGAETWSRLVDETFSLGDRLLYLRFPYLHGRDVLELQHALNALGFPAGEPDAILGAFTERGVAEFQSNTGLHQDGIAGLETVRALRNLEHVWADKAPTAPFDRRIEPQRQAGVLAQRAVAVIHGDDVGRAMAMRIANIAQAACPGSLLVDVAQDRRVPDGSALLLRLVPAVFGHGDGLPVVDATIDPATLSARMFAAAASAQLGGVVIVVMVAFPDEHEAQRVAVGLLDGVCAALSAPARSVLSSPES